MIENKMKLSTEQVKLENLLRETITVLCKNRLCFNNGFIIDALIGITTDDSETFLLKLEETVGDVGGEAIAEDGTHDRSDDNRDRTPRTRASRKRRTNRNISDTATKRQRPGTNGDSNDVVGASQEQHDRDLMLVKPEQCHAGDGQDIDQSQADCNCQYTDQSQADDNCQHTGQSLADGNGQYTDQSQANVNGQYTDNGQSEANVAAPDVDSHNSSSLTRNQSSIKEDTDAQRSEVTLISAELGTVVYIYSWIMFPVC